MLMRNVFGKFLQDMRRSIIAWAVAVAAVTAMYSAFWPAMADSAELMDAYVEAMPEVARAMGWEDMSSPAGYLNATVFGLLAPLLMVIAAIAFGTRAIAADEEEGKLELVLAHPVGRVSVLLQRFAAVVVALAVIGLAALATLLLLEPLLDLGIGPYHLFAATATTVLIALVYGSVALAVGAATGRRSYALGGAVLLAAIGYLGNTFALQVEELEWMRFLSPFYYGFDPNPLVNGFDPAYAAVLVAVPVVLVALGLGAFTRRDIAV
ncbi:ABC-2 type transport system permease protein [Nocardiopsis mwathae]|uniref:ABC-2 type transport system permease protein n=1 Tax=Nocardiopsis mwathae TaxID=1472723 RepID=A0A7W9YJ71_9ACTN|nr:ABC transporter permease subunit [Nocardiopsis mwathae]MBB6173062.1 ABC-2 type transport system permease protein [Nocardiopsis mwathae]